MDKSAKGRQNMERGLRMQKRDDRRVQLELQKRQRELQSLKESIDREIKEKSKMTEQVDMDVDDRIDEKDDREEEMLLQYIASINALDEDVHEEEEEEVEGVEVIGDEESRKLDFAGGAQIDGRNEYSGVLDLYGDEDIFDYEEQKERYMEHLHRKNKEIETDHQVQRVKSEELEGDLGLKDISWHPMEQLSTPTFLKTVGDSQTNAPKIIIKKASSTPFPGVKKSETERLDAHNYDGNLGENVIERVKALQLQAEQMAQKRRQRLSEESQLKERVIAMERKRKKLNDEMERKKQLILMKQDEDRLGRLLKQKKQEELLKIRDLEALYKREAELKRELEETERKSRMDIEQLMNRRPLQEEKRQGRHGIEDIEPTNIITRKTDKADKLDP